MHDKKRKKQSEAKKKNYREKMNPLLCVLEDLDYYIMLLMAGRDRGAGEGGLLGEMEGVLAFLKSKAESFFHDGHRGVVRELEIVDTGHD